MHELDDYNNFRANPICKLIDYRDQNHISSLINLVISPHPRLKKPHLSGANIEVFDPKDITNFGKKVCRVILYLSRSIN